MKRRSFIRQGSLAFGALTLFQQNLLASFFEDPWKITMLDDNVGIFSEKGGTIGFLLSKDGIVVVDSQFPEQSQHLIDELRKRSTQPFSLLINTHHHGDHSSGNLSFKGVATHILAHANSKINQENSAKKQKTEEKQVYPDQTYTEVWRQKFGKDWICLNYYGAAHTNGDSFIHFEDANIVHTGDLVFNRRHPYVDRGAGANIKSWIEVLNKGLDKYSRKTRYVFGHAGEGFEVTGTADDVKKFRDYLGNVLDFTSSEIRAGKTKEELLKATLIPKSEEWKTEGIKRPLEAAYDELTATRQ